MARGLCSECGLKLTTMTNNAEASAEFQSQTRSVVESFLQTVVVLDDLAEMPQSPGLPAGEAESGGLIMPDYPKTTSPVDDTTGHDPRGVPLNAESLIDGFAEIGSVCAVLKANPNNGYQERTVRAARRADIVILDWTILESTGDEALGILREILQDDQGSGRLRLIAIYTGEPDLEGIYQRARDAISDFYEHEELREPGILRMSKGPLHVVVLAKAGVLNDATQSEFGNLEVAEDGLADRLANEFAEMTGGLIRNAALAGIAGIRDNAHRILAKFDPTLDPAYLGHRLLLYHPRDAEDHLEEALVSEIASVLEEHRPGTRANGIAIKSWLDYRKAEGLELSKPLGVPGNQGAVSGWHSLLEQGLGVPGLPKPNGVSKSDFRRKATEPFAEDTEAAWRANRRFAALLTLKTRYPGQTPRLSIGTIVHTNEDGDDRYFLCLQPKCDSVRLSDCSGFPFIPLVPLTKAGEVSGGMSLRLAVEGELDQWEHFGIKGKPSELTVLFFQPGENPPGEVGALDDEYGHFFFESIDNKLYRWIAQMKDEHALRVAGEIAASLARPGPNDSEWLRAAFGSPPETDPTL